MYDSTMSIGNKSNINPFQTGINIDAYTKHSKVDLLSMLDQLFVMNDLWKLLFGIETHEQKTRKDFKKNIILVLKEMLTLADYPSLKIGSSHPEIGFYYYSHKIIQKLSRTKKWTYYNVVSFLEKRKILHLKKENRGNVSKKRLPTKLLKTLEFLAYIGSGKTYLD